jgi:hypothetical protein
VAAADLNGLRPRRFALAGDAAIYATLFQQLLFSASWNFQLRVVVPSGFTVAGVDCLVSVWVNSVLLVCGVGVSPSQPPFRHRVQT